MSHIRFETYHYQRSKDKDPQIEGKVLLDYDIEIHDLDQKDKIYYWEGTGSNYSIAGFELEFRRYKLQYIIQYYIPSGLFVVVSWVGIIQRQNQSYQNVLPMKYSKWKITFRLL